MRAVKAIGTGTFIYTLAPDLRFLTEKLPFSSITPNGEPLEVMIDRNGKTIAIMLCAVSLLGGAAYCIYKYFNPDKQPQPPGSGQFILDDLGWQISSISTLSGQETYEQLKCGITNELMIDPVSLPCSHEFSRKSIEQWLSRQKECPKCRQPAKLGDLRFVAGTAKAIQRFKQKLLKRGKQWAEKRINLEFEREILGNN